MRRASTSRAMRSPCGRWRAGLAWRPPAYVQTMAPRRWPDMRASEMRTMSFTPARGELSGWGNIRFGQPGAQRGSSVAED